MSFALTRAEHENRLLSTLRHDACVIAYGQCLEGTRVLLTSRSLCMAGGCRAVDY